MSGSRRDFLKGVGLATVAVATYAARSFAANALPDNARLIIVARTLYPYDLEDAVYREVVDSIVSDPVNLDSLQACADSLDGFLEMSEAEQIQSIETLQSATFFEDVRIAVQLELHNRPELWQLIGYEGPSLPFGGYANETPASLAWLNRP